MALGIYERVDRIWEVVLNGMLAQSIGEKDDALIRASQLCEEMCSTEHRSREVARLLAEAQYILAMDKDMEKDKEKEKE